jgi:peptidyl-dipeptidase Dcp
MSPTPNPLLQPWTAPHQLPPFADVRAEHFKPAFEIALAEQRAEVDAIAANADAPSFGNTIVALDRSGRLLARVGALFHNLTASDTSPELQAVEREMAAPLAAHGSAIYMNARLFGRVESLHATRDQLGLDAQDRRLVERVHLDFVRAGAKLGPEDQPRYA